MELGAAYGALAHETRSLLIRLGQVKPFSLLMPMVAAAALPAGILNKIERFIQYERQEIRRATRHYLNRLQVMLKTRQPSAEAQRLFTILRIRFNNFLSQFDIFADVLTQRGEHENGVFLAGLDRVAQDAMRLPGIPIRPPPLICYLGRGYGGAIRRIRTRLPGGRKNPVAIIRLPRERMICGTIAASLVHEVGHQGAVLLDLINSARESFLADKGRDRVWDLYHLWIAEILADFWSIAKLGIGATMGLITVVSLPRHFVFRLSPTDPHPMPYIRVLLSCALGKALYPDPQWERTAVLWRDLYPLAGMNQEQRAQIARITARMPEFTELFLLHRPPRLGGKTQGQVFADPARQAGNLRRLYDGKKTNAEVLHQLPPTLAFAVIGQARADGRITPEQESTVIESLLKKFALNRRNPSHEVSNNHNKCLRCIA
ncbi:MAG: hypothetical protein AB1545_05340 [Thermodesulfobacteriota bacterium]